MSLAKVLKEARIKKGISQRKLAKEIGISFMYVSHIERGTRIPISGRVLPKIAKCLELNSEEIITLAYEDARDKKVKGLEKEANTENKKEN